MVKDRLYKETYVRKLVTRGPSLASIRGFETASCRVTEGPIREYTCQVMLPDKSDKFYNRRSNGYRCSSRVYPVKDKPEPVFLANLKTVFRVLRSRLKRRLKRSKLSIWKSNKLYYLFQYAFLYELFTLKKPKLSRAIFFGNFNVNNVSSTLRKLLTKEDNKTRLELARIFQLSSWLVSSGDFPDVLSKTKYKHQGCVGLIAGANTTFVISNARICEVNSHLSGQFVASS